MGTSSVWLVLSDLAGVAPDITRHSSSPMKHECGSSIVHDTVQVLGNRTLKPICPNPQNSTLIFGFYMFLLQLSFKKSFTAMFPLSSPYHFGHLPPIPMPNCRATRVCRRLSRICSEMPSGPPKISSSRCSRAPFEAPEDRER